MSKLQAHPFADLFPATNMVALRKLAVDIRENGLREPIVMLDGQILDGRSRYQACQIAGLEMLTDDFVDFIDIDGGDPLAFVLSKNLHRRHLSGNQRAMIAAKIANMRRGRHSNASRDAAVSQASAAKALNVSKRSVERAKTVQARGIPALAEAVEAGRVPVRTAATLAREPRETQREILDSLPLALEEARKAAREIPRQIERRPAPMNGEAKVANAAPAGSVENVVSTFTAVCLHLLNRERFEILEHVPIELRGRVISSLDLVIQKATTLRAKLAHADR